jgi:hypothetical protein
MKKQRGHEGEASFKERSDGLWDRESAGVEETEGGPEAEAMRSAPCVTVIGAGCEFFRQGRQNRKGVHKRQLPCRLMFFGN